MVKMNWILLWLSLPALFLPFAFSDDLQIRWYRPHVLGNPGRYINFVNTPQDFLLLHKRIYFDACTYSGSASDSTVYQWTISDLKGTVLQDTNSTECLHGWTAPLEGDYVLQVKKFNADQTNASMATTPFFVKDIWVVGLGDSFASGQGDPDQWGNNKTGPSLWINSPCGRSTGSFLYLIYERILKSYPQHGILFTFLACSGATVQVGLLGRQPAQQAQVTDLLEKIVSTAKSNANRAPDLLLLSIGGNDIGFFNVATQVLAGTISVSSSFNRLQIPERFDNLTQSLHQLSEKFLSFGIRPSDVFYFEYFDPMRDETGKFNSRCPGLINATDNDLRVASEQFFTPLNAFVTNQSQVLGWNCVCTIGEAFRTHGYCSKESYIRTMQDSLKLQGTGIGTFHPTYQGHLLVAEKAWPQIEQHLKQEIH